MTVFDVDSSEVVPTLELMEFVLPLIFAMLTSCFARPSEMEPMQSSCTKTGIALRIIEKKSFYFKHQLHPGSENPV